MFSKDLLERLTVDRARVFEGGVDLVAEDLLEAGGLEVLAAELPIGLRTHRGGEDTKPFPAHEVVVELMEPVLPGGVPLQRPAGEVVVVGHEDVRVPMPASGIRVHRDEVVRRVHALREHDRDVPDTLHVLRIRHIEFVRVEGEHVRLQLVLATPCLCEPGGASDELLRAR